MSTASPTSFSSTSSLFFLSSCVLVNLETNGFTIGEIHQESGNVQVEDEGEVTVHDLAAVMIAGADEDGITAEMDEAYGRIR